MASNGITQNPYTQDSKRANGHQNGSASAGQKYQQEISKTDLRGKKKSLISNVMHLRRQSRRPLPTEMGDGSYRSILKRPSILADLRSVNMSDLKTLKDIIAKKLKGETQSDDKTMLMERTIQLVSGLPSYSHRREVLTNTFIDMLWNSLDHPPLLYMGDEYRYRQPDGSNNNPLMPKLGAVGQKYSRTCKPGIRSLGALPDPETVYESVMARDGFKRNPNNVSSMLWYWATIIIHDLFSTNMGDMNVNDASSYLDLAPLYGGSQEAQNSVRTFKDGKLKQDAFADKRLIGNPPGVCIILVMFNRFHNHVAKSLAEINEGGRFSKPAGNLEGDKLAAAWKKYDEDLFQTARLVTSGLYINITLIDYVRNIVNLNRVDTTWTLDPRQEMGVSVGTKEGADSGVGNVVSAEFNLCYRWHSCISEADDKWIQDFYTSLLGENYGEMNLQALMGAVRKFETTIPKDPGERTFGGFKRGEDGLFSDDDLVNALANGIESPGGAFGAQNVPRIMKPVEMLGIIRGRKWNLAGLNEFRKHFGLKAYETFEDINSDPAVADSLRNLYQHPDCVELYPGLVAEEAKAPMVPGVGIAPTYTISRVVLSDAVSLVRGDRYYTTDYHPGYLTNWGFKEANYDLNVNHGCVFYKLFVRAFPNHFKEDSVYAHYPMVIPSENHKILTNLKRVDRFNFDRPQRKADLVRVSSIGAAKYIISNEDKYQLVWQEKFAELSNPAATRVRPSISFASGQQKCTQTLTQADDWKTSVKSFYSKIADRLFAEKSYKLAGKLQADLVRDIGNLAHTNFVAQLFDIPLKTELNPKGVLSEQELYQGLATLHTFGFLDLDPIRFFSLKQNATEHASQLGTVIETNIKLGSLVRSMFNGRTKGDALASVGVNIAKALSKSGLNAHDIAWGQILPTAAASVPNQAQAFALSVDWYLSAEGEPHRDELYRLSSQSASTEADSLLLGYALEGVRLAGSSGLHRHASADDTIKEDDGRQIQVNAGDRVYVSFDSSGLDEDQFPNPSTVDPRRPIGDYICRGAGPHTFLDDEISQLALAELFRAVFRRKGLRRVAGPQGELKRATGADGSPVFMSEDWSAISPFPTSMKVTWDGE